MSTEPAAGSPEGDPAHLLTPAVAAGRPLPHRVDARFLLSHPAHFLALGCGSGLSPWAPGTVGTLWGWVVFVVAAPWLQLHGLDGPAGAGALLAALAVGWWACKVTAAHAGLADPGFIVWDEIVAIWLVLWLVWPASWWMQLLAFGLFRYFDAAKPGPVRWADRRFKRPGWPGAFGILFDDLVAAGCTLLTLALLQRAWPALA